MDDSGTAFNLNTGNGHKIKVGAVSYLNTKPLVYGFEKGMMQDKIDLVFDFPSNIAQQLLKNEIDIGLVPVAVLPMMKEYHFIAGYCIGCDGEVASVCLFSDVPLAEIKTILLDYQSRTSVALLKILLKEHWKITPELIAAEKGFEQHIKGATAGLVIGDRAFKQLAVSAYHYDLGLAWKEMTGLPFVFAAWVSNKKLSVNFTATFNEATAEGIKHIDEIVAENKFDSYDLYRYYTENIGYKMDEPKQKGLKLFLEKLGKPAAISV